VQYNNKIARKLLAEHSTRNVQEAPDEQIIHIEQDTSVQRCTKNLISAEPTDKYIFNSHISAVCGT